MIFMISLATFLFAIYSMGTGSSSNLGFWSTLEIILGLKDGTDLQSAIIWELRFPRVLMAIVGGAALATAGALMQGALGNPLVSPLTMGVASGAALGAALAIVVGWTVVDNHDLTIVANAFLFSLIVVFIIIQLGKYRSISAESYILVGIAITFISGAIVSTLQYFATDAQLSALAHWSLVACHDQPLRTQSL
jgi:iron complex transport system permease protein